MKVNEIRPEMYRAVRQNDIDKIQEIVAEFPEIISINIGVGTYLDSAAINNAHKSTLKLIELGADVNYSNRKDGNLPICAACDNGSYEVAKILIESGSRLETKTLPENPLIGATMNGHLKIVRLLLNAGIDATARYGRLQGDAIATAYLHGYPEIAEFIAEHIAEGDNQKRQELLEYGKMVASKEGKKPKNWMRIIPRF